MTCVRTLMSGHFIFASVFAGGLDFHAIGGAFHKGNTLRQDTCLFKTSTKGFPRALPVHAVSNSGVACRFRCCSNFLQTCKNDSQTFGAYLSRNLFASLSLDTFASAWPLPPLDRRDAISAIVPNYSMSSLSRCCKGSRPLHMTLVRKPLDFFPSKLDIRYTTHHVRHALLAAALDPSLAAPLPFPDVVRGLARSCWNVAWLRCFSLCLSQCFTHFRAALSLLSALGVWVAAHACLLALRCFACRAWCCLTCCS